MPKTSITFKVTNNEKQAINDTSSIEKITISDYVRQAVMNRLNDGKTMPDNRLTNVLQAQLETKDDQIKTLQHKEIRMQDITGKKAVVLVRGNPDPIQQFVNQHQIEVMGAITLY